MKTILLSVAISAFANFSFGAEVFIRVLKTGTHYSTVYNQTQYNLTNIFRFFDLPGGTISIQVIEQTTGAFIYNSSIYLNSNQRIVAELDNLGNLQIIQNTTVEYVNWYTNANSNNGVVIFPNGNSTNNSNNFNNANTQYNQQMFNQFLTSLDKETFDSKKLDKAKKYIDKGNLVSTQITEISKKFSFDSNRLDWTKYAYTKCNDKQNYFILKETFTFSTNYSDLEEYMLNH